MARSLAPHRRLVSLRPSSAKRGRGGRSSRPAIETLEGRQLLSASVAGTVYNDLNVAGTFKAGDPLLAGVRVYVDLGNHNAYTSGDPNAFTTSSGTYQINGLSNGTFTLREVVPTGSRQSQPSNGVGQPITVVSAATHLTGVNFGDTQKVRLSGFVFDDANGDAVENHKEVIVAGATVYLDANGNKKFDPSSEMHITTDSTGYWVIGDLPPGKTYTARVVAPTGDVQTDPTGNGGHTVTLQNGQTADNLLFGVRPATVIFNSQDRNVFAGAGLLSKDNQSTNVGVYDATSTITDSSGDNGTASLTSSLTATTLTTLGSLSTVQKGKGAEAVIDIDISFTLSAATTFSAGYDIFGNQFTFSLEKNNTTFIIDKTNTTDANTTSYAYSTSTTLAAGQYTLFFQVIHGTSSALFTKGFVMNFSV